MTSEVVFLVDVDNTMLDNDRVVADLRRHLAWHALLARIGEKSAQLAGAMH